MILDQFFDVRQLAPPQQRQLAFELLDELYDDERAVADPTILSILEERRSRFEAHPETASRWEELRERIQSSRNRAAQHA